MATFHFPVVDGGEHPDEEGVELPDRLAARRMALEAAANMLLDMARGEASYGDTWTMHVTNERGLTLYNLDFQLSVSPAVSGSTPR